jgi:peptidoglycan/LPS O-acetylase OafA/YrhL
LKRSAWSQPFEKDPPIEVDKDKPKVRNDWRTDLEGLRFVVILLIATYHVWSERISGGIDIFLMLSGFFFGRILWRKHTQDRFPRFPAYLVKLLRRLAPALVVVVGATTFTFALLNSPALWGEGARQVLASLFYFENWYLSFVGQTYEVSGLTTSPWQHFWSISVQFQFLLFTPILLMTISLLARNKSQTFQDILIIWSTLLVALCSFCFSIWLVDWNQ